MANLFYRELLNPGSPLGGATTIPTAGLMGWWKADVGVTKDGSNKVSAWADQSGNGRNFTQPTTGNQPLWQASIKNALPGIQFNAGQGLQFATFGACFSAMMVITYPTATFARSTLISNNGATDAWEMWASNGAQSWQFNPFDVLYRRNGATRATNETISPLNQSHFIVGNRSTGFAGSFAGQVLGNWTDYFNQWYGHVHELAFWNAQLSTPAITQVENYLVNKWGSF
jgi:hypothetical protein